MKDDELNDPDEHGAGCDHHGSNNVMPVHGDAQYHRNCAVSTSYVKALAQA